ncbi:MAG: hypothetical protein ACR2N0_17070 [Rubrobacteraceae bacterium]
MEKCISENLRNPGSTARCGLRGILPGQAGVLGRSLACEAGRPL